MAHLRRLQEPGPPLSDAFDLEERGRARRVEVPDVVVDVLIVPDHLPRLGVEGHGRAAVVIEAVAPSPEQVGGRVARRDEDQPALGVPGHDRPDVRCPLRESTPRGRVGLGGVARRNRIPRPLERPRPGVESTHDTAGRVDPDVVRHQRTDHDTIADHLRRRGRMVFPGRRVPDPLAERDSALLAESAAGLSRVCVQRVKLGVGGAVEDPFGADRTRVRVAVFPVGHPATDQRVRAFAVSLLEARVEVPDLLAGLGVEGEDLHEGGAVVEEIVHDERRRLKSGHLRISRSVEVVTASVHPGDLETRNVLGRDLRERRVMARAPGAAPMSPLRDRTVVRDVLSATGEAPERDDQREEQRSRNEGGTRLTGHDRTPCKERCRR